MLQQFKGYYQRFKQNRALKNTAIYSFGAVFLRGISLYLLPIYTRYLTKADYGMLDLLTTFTSVLTPVFSGGLPQIIFINYYHTEGEKRERMIREVVLTFFMYALPLLILSLFASHFIAGRISTPDIPVSAFPTLYMVIIPAFLGFFVSVTFTLLMNAQRAVIVSIMQIISGTLMAGMAIYGVMVLRLGFFAIIAATFIGTSLQTLFCIYLGKRFSRIKGFTINFSKIYEYMKLGSPFIIGALANWVLISADRWFLAHYRSMDELGLYAVSYKFGFVFQEIVMVPFVYAFAPHIMEHYRKSMTEGLRFTIRTSLTFLGISIVFILSMVVILKYTYIYIVGKPFVSSFEFTPWILIGFFFWGLAQVWNTSLMYFKKTVQSSSILVLSAIINLASCFFLVPKYGAMGAAWSTIIAYLSYFLLTLVFNILIIKEARASTAST